MIEQQNKANKVSASYEAERFRTAKVRTQVVYKQIEKIVTKPVYRNVCIDDSGLSEINSLIKPTIPANLMQPCPELNTLESGDERLMIRLGNRHSVDV